MTEPPTGLDEAEWRSNRDPGWHHDIGYSLLDALRAHRYDYGHKGDRPDDPGWHECDCGWAGYWCDFEIHVASQLRIIAAAVRADERAKVLAGVSRTREWLVAFEHGPTDGPFDELAEAEEWAQRFPESVAKILTREQAHYVSEWEPTP